MDIDVPTVRDFNLDRDGYRGQSTMFCQANWTGKYVELHNGPHINIVGHQIPLANIRRVSQSLDIYWS